MMHPRGPHPSDLHSPGREGSDHLSVIRVVLTLLAVALALAAALAPRAPGGQFRRAGEEVPLELGAGPDASRFARVTEPRPFTLPRDHGPHFEYQTEWWYFTGNAVAAEGRRFGFQLTFFRRGLTPGPPPDGAGLSSNQVYFAHFAITDVAGGRHVAAERFSRGAGGLAGASGEPFAVWLENWRADSLKRDGGAVRLAARDEETGLSLDLELAATKPLVAHGNRGLSPKSDEQGNASYYVGYTRMTARGRLGVSGDASVEGEAWFDHEWSTSALGPGAVGWDWFSLQLDDGREVMLFQIRREGGSVEPVSGGTLVEREGRARRLRLEDVSVDALDHWTSPESGGRYPSLWRVRVPSAGLDLLVEPRLDDQEMRTSFVYWEGAVRVSGSSPAASSGQGYVELTGYARSMQGVF
ncbi:MAG TPA: lipocalin-like domain-containing protein [Vicinamibacteria bacterium]|nr:lipocalin-like domain-containing protein [Vicinamibacteria bacterium]